MSDSTRGDAHLRQLERLRARARDVRVAEYVQARALRADALRWRQDARALWPRLVPTHTLAGVDLGFCPRRFSPGTGRYLLGFGAGAQNMLVVRRVTGAAVDARAGGDRAAQTLLEPLHEVTLPGGYPLCRDFCLVTDDEEYVIAAGSSGAPSFASANARPQKAGVRTSAHSFCAESENAYTRVDAGPPEDVRLYVVSTRSGAVCDTLSLDGDAVLLPGHAGVAMRGRRLAVLSAMHQTVWLFDLDASGRLVFAGAVGASLGSVEEQSSILPGDALCDRPLLGLRQRIMAYLYRRMGADLHAYADAVLRLALLRVQFLDEDTLLLRLGCGDIAPSRARVPGDAGGQQAAFFVALRTDTWTVTGFWRSTSEEMYRDVFLDPRLPRSTSDAGHSWVATPGNEAHERRVLERSAALVASLRGDASAGAIAARRALQTLPLGAQLHAESPLVDPALFRYDERSVGPLDKARPAGDAPVRFYSRRTDRHVFSLDTALPAGVPDAAAQAAAALGFRPRRFAAYIFHPCLPLVVSGQHSVLRASLYNVHCVRGVSPSL